MGKPMGEKASQAKINIFFLCRLLAVAFPPAPEKML